MSNLVLDGRPLGQISGGALPSPTVNGDDDVFDADDVTNDRAGICFAIGGAPGYGVATGTVIRDSRIHGCGRLPSTNRDHGVYITYASRTRVIGNWIYANADRGIQLFPDAQRTVIEDNVIDRNGEGVSFGGEDGRASSANLVKANLITNAAVRTNVASFYPAGTAPGTGNLVTDNCIWGSVGYGAAGIDLSGGGFVLRANRIADPGYVNAARHDYRLRDDSPCSALSVPEPPTP